MWCRISLTKENVLVNILHMIIYGKHNHNNTTGKITYFDYIHKNTSSLDLLYIRYTNKSTEEMKYTN